MLVSGTIRIAAIHILRRKSNVFVFQVKEFFLENEKLSNLLLIKEIMQIIQASK